MAGLRPFGALGVTVLGTSRGRHRFFTVIDPILLLHAVEIANMTACRESCLNTASKTNLSALIADCIWEPWTFVVLCMWFHVVFLVLDPVLPVVVILDGNSQRCWCVLITLTVIICMFCYSVSSLWNIYITWKL